MTADACDDTAAAGGAAAEVAADEAAARQVVHKESLGGLRLDQPVSEVIKLLGKPEKETKLVFQEADGNYIQTWKYPSKGLELGISAGAKPTGPAKPMNRTCTDPEKGGGVLDLDPWRWWVARGFVLLSHRWQIATAGSILHLEPGAVAGTRYGVAAAQTGDWLGPRPT